MATMIDNFLGQFKNADNAAYLEAVAEIYNTLYEAGEAEPASEEKTPKTPKTLEDREAASMQRKDEISGTINGFITSIVNAGVYLDLVTHGNANIFTGDLLQSKDNETVIKLDDLLKQAAKDIDLGVEPPSENAVNNWRGVLYPLYVGGNALDQDLIRKSIAWILRKLPSDIGKPGAQESWARSIVSIVKHFGLDASGEEKVYDAAKQFASAFVKNAVNLHKYMQDVGRDMANIYAVTCERPELKTRESTGQKVVTAADIKDLDVASIADAEENDASPTADSQAINKTVTVRSDERKIDHDVMIDLFNASAEGKDLTIQVPINFNRATKQDPVNLALMKNTYTAMKSSVVAHLLALSKKVNGLRTLLDSNGLMALRDGEKVFETTILDATKFEITEVKIADIEGLENADVYSGVITFKYKKNASSIKSILDAIVEFYTTTKNFLCNIKLGDIADAEEAGVQDLGEEGAEFVVQQNTIGELVDPSLDINKDENTVGVCVVCETPSAAEELASFARTLPAHFLSNVSGIRTFANAANFNVGITSLKSDPNTKNVVSLIFKGDLNSVVPQVATTLKVAMAGMESAMVNYEKGLVAEHQHSAVIGHSLKHDQSEGQKAALRQLLQSHRTDDRRANRNMFFNEEFGYDILGNGEDYVPFSREKIENLLVKDESDKIGKVVAQAVIRFLTGTSREEVNEALTCDQTDPNSFAQIITKLALRTLNYRKANKLESVEKFVTSLLEAFGDDDETGINPFASFGADESDEDETAAAEAPVAETPVAEVPAASETPAEQPEDDAVTVDEDASASIMDISTEISEKLTQSGIIDYLITQSTRGSAKTSDDDDFSEVSSIYGDQIKDIINKTPNKQLAIAVEASNSDDPIFARVNLQSLLADTIVSSDPSISREDRKAVRASIIKELDEHKDKLLELTNKAIGSGAERDKLLGGAQSYMQQLASLYSNRARTKKAIKDAGEFKGGETNALGITDAELTKTAKSDAEISNAIANRQASLSERVPAADSKKLNPYSRMRFGSRTHTRK